MKYSFGEFELLASRQQLLDSGRPLRLGSRAFGLLLILLENAGELVTKDQLIASVWPGVWVDESNLRVHMGALRKALGDGQSGRRFILNVPGRGYRFIEPVTKSSGATVPPSAATEPFGHVMPPPPIRLVGRSDAVESLSSQLSRKRMITIVGPGGIGKTSLALAVADLWSHTESTKRVFIDLSATTDAERLWAVAATAFDAEFTSEPRTHVLRSISAEPALLILDNCEHIIEAAAQFSETVLNASNKATRVLATSREPLRVAEEWVHRLLPLHFPDNHVGLTTDEALKFSAIALFIERIIANHDQFEFTQAEVPAAVEICQRLGGNPLALELAAARADLFTLAQLAQGLNDRFGLLTRGKRTAFPRHQTLRAVLEWSYQLLSPMEQSLLRRLSVFPATFDISDAAELALRHGAEAGTYLDGVSNLVAKSMLTVDISGEAARYRFYETTRAFALEELSRAGEANHAFLSLTNYMLSKLLAAPGSDEKSKLKWLEECRLGLDNVRVALDWALSQAGNLSAGLNLVMAVLPVWLQLSRLGENCEFLELALEALAQQPDRRHDKLALETSIGLSSYFSTGQAPAVIARLASALAIARSLSAKPQELSILWMLYGISGNWGDYQAAIRFADDYAIAAERMSEPVVKLKQHRILARAKHDLGDHANALLHLDQALSIPVNRVTPVTLNAYEIDDITAALAVKSRVLWVSGQVDDSLSVAEECLERGLKVDHAQSICWALMYKLCPVAIWRGDLTFANRLAAIASAQSEKTFEHWYNWSRMYQVALQDLANPREARAFPKMFAEMIPSQEDLFATFSPIFASPKLSARASPTVPTWCTSELMRVDVEASASRRTTGEKETLLLAAYRIAEEQGARSWQLRLATSLARLKQEEDDTPSMRAVLEPVLAMFKQGYQTRDWKIAAELV